MADLNVTTSDSLDPDLGYEYVVADAFSLVNAQLPLRDYEKLAESLSYYSDQLDTHENTVVLVTAAITMSDTVATAEATGNNLVDNGTFENAPPFTAATNTISRWINGTAGGGVDPAGSQYGWAIAATLNGTAAGQFDSSQSHAGSSSLKLSTLATGSGIVTSNSWTTSPASAIFTYCPAVLPGVSYTLTFWMKTQANSGAATTGAFLDVAERNGTTAGTVATHTSTAVQTTTAWTQYTISFTAAAASRFLEIRPKLTGSDGAGTLIMDAWFDDISLSPVYNDIVLSYMPPVSDSTAASESIGLAVSYVIALGDTAPAGELISLAVPGTIAVSDSSATSDSSTLAVPGTIAAADTAAIGESVSLQIREAAGESDSTSLSEISVLQVDEAAGVIETAAMAESLQIAVISRVVALSIPLAETLVLFETLAIFSPELVRKTYTIAVTMRPDTVHLVLEADAVKLFMAEETVRAILSADSIRLVL